MHILFMLALVFAAAATVRAEFVQMINGDRYRGTVLSLDQTNVVFQSEVQGRVLLPRAKVAAIVLHEAVSLPQAAMPAAQPVPARPGPDAVLRQLRTEGVDPQTMQQIQQQLLGAGSPEASQKFDELLGGLMAGRLNIRDIRTEAQKSIAEIEKYKQELGPELGDVLDSYLGILQRFVDQTEAKPAPEKP